MLLKRAGIFKRSTSSPKSGRGIEIDKEEIKRLRAKLGLSQEGLARELGVAAYAVRRWENGRVKPSPFVAEKLKLLKRELQKDGQ